MYFGFVSKGKIFKVYRKKLQNQKVEY